MGNPIFPSPSPGPIPAASNLSLPLDGTRGLPIAIHYVTLQYLPSKIRDFEEEHFPSEPLRSSSARVLRKN